MSAVTFTRVTQTHDAATGRVTPSKLEFATACVSMDAHSVIRQFGLITARQIGVMVSTLPGVYPPRLGDKFPWGGETYTVKDVKPFSPNGIDTIYSDVLAER